jgi:hypothetical protein
VYSKEVADVKQLVAAIEAAVDESATKGKKIYVEQVSCDFTKENTAGKPDLNTPEVQEAGEQEEYCDNCGRVMVLKRGLFGPFMSCPGYNEDPPCKTIRKLSQKQQQKQNAPQPTGEQLSGLRQAAGAAARVVWGVCFVLRLPQVQIREAEFD